MEFNENLTIEEWTNNNSLAISIFNNKYKHNDETFMQTVRRISGDNEEIMKMILNKMYLPGGRICSNRGLDKEGRKVSLSNCYVLPQVEDNIESIFDTAKEMARTYSMGGGVGVSISKLSFNGAKVRNAANCSSGAVSFMELYSHITGLISQNGRRGALMISMDVSHPDIEEFIDIKNDLNKVTKANISVQISDEFMEAVKSDKDFTLYFKREETGEEKTKVVKARDLFHKICYNAWNMAEPGVLFWDTINKYNILSEDKNYEYAGVNPCSEEPLPAYGACLLGSINLSEFVDNPFTDEATFNIEEFTNKVDKLVRELNIILDEGIPLHPLKEQSKTASDWRQIGLGIMGLADTFIKMGITYGSEDSIELSDDIGFIMADQAIKTSALLAKKYGTYPMYNKEAVLKSKFFTENTSITTHGLVEANGLRNSQILTIAPTGSISNVLGVSGGIEPIFAISYTRKTETLHGEDTYYKVYTPIVKEYMEKFNIKDENDLPEYFITSQEIKYEDRIKVQAAWQKHIDASISSTVNLPESATVEDIEDLYMKAWENGLKGITVYRDNCKRSGILTTNKKESVEKSTDEPNAITEESVGLARGEILKVSDHDGKGLKRKLITGCGSLHCVALFHKETGQLLETYLSKGSTGGCNNFMVGLSRMISQSARLGASIYDIVDQLKSTGSCPSYAVRRATKGDTSLGSCCPMAAGFALLDMYNEFNHLGKYANKENNIPDKNTYINKSTDTINLFVGVEELSEDALCPQCGSKLINEVGCDQCKNCGWTKCD